jgi:hypothetical protein
MKEKLDEINSMFQCSQKLVVDHQPTPNFEASSDKKFWDQISPNSHQLMVIE